MLLGDTYEGAVDGLYAIAKHEFEDNQLACTEFLIDAAARSICAGGGSLEDAIERLKASTNAVLLESKTTVVAGNTQ
ncbi:hypothetical protein [Roseibium sp. SCP14]|uniref:hypothetical protein n=1 Tax=Roseibium sp. SCP14 TaxID=3141375 RepID=UPI00333B00E9